jgi:hypothetical protein
MQSNTEQSRCLALQILSDLPTELRQRIFRKSFPFTNPGILAWLHHRSPDKFNFTVDTKLLDEQLVDFVIREKVSEELKIINSKARLWLQLRCDLLGLLHSTTERAAQSGRNSISVLQIKKPSGWTIDLDPKKPKSEFEPRNSGPKQWECRYCDRIVDEREAKLTNHIVGLKRNKRPLCQQCINAGQGFHTLRW